MADPERRKPYDLAARRRETLTQNVIVGDFLTPPSIDEINVRGYTGRPGEAISIRADDDFDVVSVVVAISGSEGQPYEEGQATLTSMNSGLWAYTTTTAIPAGTHLRVAATATDGPGNRTTKSEDVVV